MPPQDDVLVSDDADDLFEKARQAAEALDFDDALSGYIEGLRLDPEVPAIHTEMRKVSLKRFKRGGSDPTREEMIRYQQAEDPLDKMLAAELLFAKQPGHLPHAERFLRAAVAGQYTETATWIADLLYVANHKSPNPSLDAYLLLKDMYSNIGVLDRAIMACKRAIKLSPQDRDLVKQLRALSTTYMSTERKHRAQDTGVIAARLNGLVEPSAKPVYNQDSDLNTEDDAMPSSPSHDAALLFFQKGKKAAESGNFDYAIDLFIDGLRKDPEAVEDGHVALCRIGLKRQGQKGKKPSVVDRARALRGKTPLDQMLNAEYLFAKDPGNISFAEAMLKAAIDGGYRKTAGWIANLIFQNNSASNKPAYQTYILLKESFKSLQEYDKAVLACQRAMQLRPDREDLAKEFKNLSAELTMARGKYDQAGDFRKAIKNPEKQELQYAQDRVVKTQDWRLLAIRDARKALSSNPSLPKNIYELAAALEDLEDEKAGEEAITLLETAFREQSNFSFRERAGKLKIKQARRRLNTAKTRLSDNPENAEDQNKYEEITNQLAELELTHYRDCVEQYPTDRRFKYEYALRLLAKEQYDQAIPLFQEASKDPGRKFSSMNQIGLCFFAKGWLEDAIDVFTQAIEEYELRDDEMGKELRYNLARTYEEKDEKEKAFDVYRKIAQSDFSYRDVSERVNQLRKGQ
jgi:tetratricopeptide (TPR) repeat protein